MNNLEIVMLIVIGWTILTVYLPDIIEVLLFRQMEDEDKSFIDDLFKGRKR